MSKNQARTNLRNILAELYPNKADAQRVAGDAGMNLSQVALNDKAINTWDAILKEAVNTDSLERLIQEIHKQYRTNLDLQDFFLKTALEVLGSRKTADADELEAQIAQVSEGLVQIREEKQTTLPKLSELETQIVALTDELKQIEQRIDAALGREQEVQQQIDSINLARIEQIVKEGTEHTIRALDGVLVIPFGDYQDLLEYVIQQLGQVKEKRRIDDLTWGGPRILEKTVSTKRIYEKYLSTIVTVSSEPDVEYREVMTFPTLERLDRAEAALSKNPYGYNLRYYNWRGESQQIPLLSFMVIDSEEVVLSSYREPYLPVEGECRLAIRQPDVVRLFQDYYETIWHGAKVIKEGNRIEWSILEQIRQQL